MTRKKKRPRWPKPCCVCNRCNCGGVAGGTGYLSADHKSKPKIFKALLKGRCPSCGRTDSL